MKKRILIVEDNPEIYQFYIDDLVECCQDVALVHDYEAALKWVSANTVQKNVSEKIKDVFTDDILFFIDNEIPRGDDGVEEGLCPEKLGSLIAEGLVENFGVAAEKVFCTSSNTKAVKAYPPGCQAIGKLQAINVAKRFLESKGGEK